MGDLIIDIIALIIRVIIWIVLAITLYSGLVFLVGDQKKEVNIYYHQTMFCPFSSENRCYFLDDLK